MRYQAYLTHQKEKTLDPIRRKKWLGKEWDLKLKGFRGLFRQYAELLAGCGRALCVGARTGQEVLALREMGVDAIGIDLVPCEPLVIKGDMHQVPFDDESFGFVFSNSVDHAIYPERFASEVERVLRPGGHVLLQLQVTISQDQYTAFHVKTPEDVTHLFVKCQAIIDRKIKKNFAAMIWELLLEKTVREPSDANQ